MENAMPDMPFTREMFPGAIPKEEAEAQALFDAEWNKAVRLLSTVTSLDDPRIAMPHDEDGQPLPPHAVLVTVFPSWLKIQSTWDRRSMLLHVAFRLSKAGMTSWRKANMYTLDRRPDIALSLLIKVGKPTKFDRSYAEHCGAFAQAYLGLTQYTEALEWARKATETPQASGRLQVILADALMLTGACDEANAIYSQRMSLAKPMRNEADPISAMFANLFARDTGTVASPVFAITIAETITDPEASNQLWTLLEAEFYDSPYFRMQHAYHLAKHGQKERGIAKLLSVAMEMPWVREATLNASAALETLSLPGNVDGVQAQLQKRIAANGWSTDGMHKMEISW